MANNKDFKVKNGIQPTVYHEGVGTVVSGTTGYNIAGASYDSVSFSVASEETVPYKIRFNNDGTKLYMIGVSGDDINQYTLSTAFDISTASYDSVSFSVASQETDPYGLAFNNDGTKMYITGNVSNSVFQYSLSTGFDLSTASYDSVSLNVNSQDTIPTGIIFNNTGSKLYMIGQSSDQIHQYTLTTDFNLSTASYDSVSFSIASQETSPMDMAFNSDGTKMYIVGSSSDTVFQYSLSTAYDISTASYDSVSFNVNTQDSGPRSLVFNNDGTKMYIIGTTTDSIYQYSTVQNTNTLDLSTGSVFEVTPTSDIQVNLSNPADSGTVSQATLLLDQQGAGPIGLFSTTLYTGNNSTQTITNGIDLTGDGGLVWIKNRSAGSTNHSIFDTESGATGGTRLRTNLSNGLQTFNGSAVFTTSSTGFALNNDASNDLNDSIYNYVSWTFKKEPSFFDVVTYTGDGTGTQNISHNLGAVPGCIIVKRTDTTEDWWVYHRGINTANDQVKLNTTDAAGIGSFRFGVNGSSLDINSSTFTVGGGSFGALDLNQNNGTYVAYLFAHDTASDSNIKCGSYTGNGTYLGGPDINLGWTPQWLLIKRSSGTESWRIADNVRGIAAGTAGAYLSANLDNMEAGSFGAELNSTGFKITSNNDDLNASGSDYIYIAIRNESSHTITYPSTLEWPSGTAPTSPAIGETDVLTFSTTDGGTSYQAVQAIDGAK